MPTPYCISAEYNEVCFIESVVFPLKPFRLLN